MKKFVLKTLDIILNIILILSVLYSVFNIVLTFLPVEVQEKVFTALNMSKEYIATFSVSSTINAVILVTSKILQTYNKIKLTAQLAKAEEINAKSVQVNEIVVDRVNAVINNLNVLQRLSDALLTVQKVTTERNIKASDKLVYKADKDAYKKALEDIEEAKKALSEVNNISTVYEKTEVKEVIVEKEKPDELSGRV